MDSKKFTLWNRICAALAFVVSAVTYLLTIEPSASFWDCGEFIASSYKLEVGHPPGNPVFQLFARFFTLFGDNMHAAVLVNAMSALCSALTIFFLYLTIVWLARRLMRPAADGSYGTAQAVAIFGSGLVGALVYTFSDTFWFSAVEGEVYAMSSLFTAVVFWLMTVWYDRADEPHALRWIVLIAFLMGLSIGVHLLNLLAIPALVFMYYYRRREDRPFTFWELVKVLLVGVVILALLVFLFIPYLPKLAAYCDLFFVNVLGLPYNTGAAFFLAVVLALLFWGLFRTLMFFDGDDGVQRLHRFLKNASDFGAANRLQFIKREFHEIAIFKQNLTAHDFCTRPRQQTQNAHRSHALSATGLAHQCKKLTRINVKRNTVRHLQRPFAITRVAVLVKPERHRDIFYT